MSDTIRKKIKDAIAENILSGELKTGQKLPSEREMAEKMGVSRSIVHLAIEDLGAAGLIEIRPRSGLYVADCTKRGENIAEDSLRCSLEDLSSPSSVRSAMELLCAVESASVMRMAEKADDAALSSLKDLFEKLKAASGGGFAHCLGDFHSEIVLRCGNTVFPVVLSSFGENCVQLWRLITDFWGEGEMIETSLEILELISRGCGEDACQILNELFTQAERSLNNED